MKKFYSVFAGVLFSFFSLVGLSQIEQGGLPPSIENPQLFKSVLVFETMPSIDIEKLMSEDTINDKYSDIPWRFGENIEVKLNHSNSGSWDYFPKGDRVWRLGIKCPGAFTINLTFDNYRLPPGAKLFIYNIDQTHIIGAFTDFNNQEDKQFATTLVKGDEIILEYYEPPYPAFPGDLSLTRVTHGYRDAYGYAKAFGNSGSCNVNVVCPSAAGMENQIRSVCMLVSGGNGFCSGALINNTSADGKPYVLSADHCYSSPGSVVYWFNWQSPTCSNPGSSPPYNSMSGATQRARNSTSDFWLVELLTSVPSNYNVYFSGWNRTTDNYIAGKIWGIHHPSGDIKKISWSFLGVSTTTYLQNTVPGNGSHWRITNWSDGTTTEGGSSGSPVFDPAGRIIGQLHGGYASCSSITSDWYGKFGVSWTGGGTSATRLSNWLDPINSGVFTLNGYDPNSTPNPPVANFTASTTTPGVGATVIFTDQSTNAPTSWLWSFSPSTVTYVGGTTSTSQNPQVQFNAAGYYTVTLTATNSAGSDVETKTNYILASVLPPVANFSASSTTPVIGQTVTFTDLSTNAPTSWAWSFNPATVTYVGGTTAASQHPQVQFNASGYYTVTLTATNAGGSDGETKTNYIHATVPPPVANFSASFTTPAIGQSVIFTDLSTNSPTSWAWSFNPATVTYVGGTTAASQHPQVQFNVAGYYSVTLTASNAGGSDGELKPNYIFVSAYAASTATLQIGSTDISGLDPGDKVYVPVYCDAISANLIIGFQFFIAFDHAVLAWDGTSTNPLPGLQGVHPNFPYNASDWLLNDNGAEMVALWIDPDFSGEQINPGETFFTYVFTYLGGETELTWGLSENVGSYNGFSKGSTEMYDENFGYYQLTLINGSIVNNGIRVNLNVLLEGPYNGTGMTPMLTGMIPLTQPYQESPWNYNGSESVLQIPADVIDWVLVELRDAMTPEQATSGTRIGERAGFLRNDGKIIDTAGNEGITFTNTTFANNLYVVIHHRNHLSIMSSSGLTESSGVYPYDFTTGSAQAYGGTAAHKQIGPGVWGMIGGDGNKDGQITPTDKSPLWDTQSGTQGYSESDYNLDTQTDNKDKDDIWAPNLGAGSQVLD